VPRQYSFRAARTNFKTARVNRRSFGSKRSFSRRPRGLRLVAPGQFFPDVTGQWISGPHRLISPWPIFLFGLFSAFVPPSPSGPRVFSDTRLSPPFPLLLSGGRRTLPHCPHFGRLSSPRTFVFPVCRGGLGASVISLSSLQFTQFFSPPPLLPGGRARPPITLIFPPPPAGLVGFVTIRPLAFS